MLDSSAPTGADGGAEWRCQLTSLRQETRLAGECPDPQQIGRESLDGEEWDRRSCWTATAGTGTGRNNRAGEGTLPGPELASAPDRGLDAQPTSAPDRGMDGFGGERLEAEESRRCDGAAAT